MKAIVSIKFYGRPANAEGIFENHQDDIVVEDWPDDAPTQGNWGKPAEATDRARSTRSGITSCGSRGRHVPPDTERQL
jgi:hypothetical protein